MAKNHRLNIMVSAEELEKIKRKANEVEMKPSTYVRLVAIKSVVEVRTVVHK